ncbi:MAG: hypothetical protein A3C55_05985 [Gammaproteobacteria bacterium RIFCSPHIGHO2_02_FULL_42_13]|nr:MAG: hypothetical protein A3C55_05985 [Gammaproteobacteria bacterium RIFCSPHIGHO2_02_FULL_42_13]
MKNTKYGATNINVQALQPVRQGHVWRGAGIGFFSGALIGAGVHAIARETTGWSMFVHMDQRETTQISVAMQFAIIALIFGLAGAIMGCCGGAMMGRVARRDARLRDLTSGRTLRRSASVDSQWVPLARPARANRRDTQLDSDAHDVRSDFAAT